MFPILQMKELSLRGINLLKFMQPICSRTSIQIQVYETSKPSPLTNYTMFNQVWDNGNVILTEVTSDRVNSVCKRL